MDKWIKKVGGTIVEAVKLTQDNVDNVANWAQAQIVEEKNPFDRRSVSESLNVKTPDGKKRCSGGMYVVKVINFDGSFFVAPGVQFELMYERLGSAPEAPKTSTQKPLITDPFEGITRVNEGPKP